MDGYKAFHKHRGSKYLQAFAPAESMTGEDAVKMHLPPEPQSRLQMAMPHIDPWAAFIEEWNQARREFK